MRTIQFITTGMPADAHDPVGTGRLRDGYRVLVAPVCGNDTPRRM